LVSAAVAGMAEAITAVAVMVAGVDIEAAIA
jgi:hypothetical protein